MNENSVQKLGELIKDIDIAMLTTVDASGHLRSRPMVTQRAEFDGVLWFFTSEDSAKVHEAQHEKNVNVAYSEPSENRYVSVSGKAYLVEDRNRMEVMWRPELKTWFPNGLDDPNLALLKIEIDKAEYWDAPSSVFVELTGFVKSMTTDEPPQDPGDHESLNL